MSEKSSGGGGENIILFLKILIMRVASSLLCFRTRMSQSCSGWSSKRSQCRELNYDKVYLKVTLDPANVCPRDAVSICQVRPHLYRLLFLNYRRHFTSIINHRDINNESFFIELIDISIWASTGSTHKRQRKDEGLYEVMGLVLQPEHKSMTEHGPLKATSERI